MQITERWAAATEPAIAARAAGSGLNAVRALGSVRQAFGTALDIAAIEPEFLVPLLL